MIRNVIFDFGASPGGLGPASSVRQLFQRPAEMRAFPHGNLPYFWNTTVDAGKSTADATAERIALFPEWEKEISMYYGEWIKMMGVERVKKPDARLYRILLDRFSMKTEESIFIDDSRANLDGGEALGIRGILFESAEKLREDLSEVLQGRFRSCAQADRR